MANTSTTAARLRRDSRLDCPYASDGNGRAWTWLQFVIVAGPLKTEPSKTWSRSEAPFSSTVDGPTARLVLAVGQETPAKNPAALPDGNSTSGCSIQTPAYSTSGSFASLTGAVKDRPPARSARSCCRLPHRCKADRLSEPLVAGTFTYPLKLLACN